MSGPEQLLDALGKLPAVGGVAARGLADVPGSVPPMSVLTGVLSASRDVRVATENLTSRCLLVLLVRTGREVSALSRHPDEAEVLLLPGSLWKRLPDLTPHGSPLPVVVLEEVDPAGYSPPEGWPTTLADLTEHLAVMLRTAQRADPVPVSRPGTFSGPWPALPTSV
ncbi:MAG: hypothetical protein FWD18_01920 [Micrococcales bacterium]|nr:hypothetical protein [Micrococcales bacterium]